MSINIMKNTHIALFILVLIFAFGWFELRPVSIRANCENQTLENGLTRTSTIEREQLKGDMNRINSYEREKSVYYYQKCLHENGLAN